MFFYDKQLYENVEDLALETGTLLHGWLKRAVDSRVSTTSFYLVSLNSRNFLSKPTIMDKSLGTLLRFWGVFQFTQVEPLPSSHKKCWTRVSRIFFEFSLCIGWGEGELQKLSKRTHLFKREPRNDRKIWIFVVLSQGLSSRIVVWLNSK